MKKNIMVLSRRFSIAVIALTFSNFASAQLLEEIIVEAQKREQNLQDVGIAVTAFSGDQLRALGITDSIDLVAQTPGLEVSGAGGGVINTFSIRGVTQNDFSPIQEAPVAVYVDEAYISLNVVTGFSLYDLERVEVLRGPQGTLFGRNATGGLVHYITKSPTHESEGFIEAGIGEDGRHRFEGAVSGGLSETISGRLSAVMNKHEGLIENDIGPDVMDADSYSVRGQLAVAASDDLDIRLKAQYSDQDDRAGGYAHRVGFSGAFDTTGAADFFGYRDADGDLYTGSYDFDGFKRTEVTEVLAQIDYNFGDYVLSSVTDFQSIDDAYAEDADASPISVYNYVQNSDVDQFSQELRLSKQSKNANTVVGLFYLNIDGDYQTQQSGDGFFGPGVTEVVDTAQKTTTIALFAQTEIDLSDSLLLTVGIRYNDDDKDYQFATTNAFALPGITQIDTDSSEDNFSGKLQLDYKPNDDWLVYGGINRGIKAGGFNMPLFPITSASLEFEGEELTSYEVGFKGALTETTRLNATAFYYDYDDYQAYSFDGFAAILFNANAKSQGMELELTSNPLDGLDILLGVSILDTEVSDIPATISPTGTEDAALSPELTFNALIRYAWPAFDGELSVQLDGNWKDDQNYNLSFSPIIQEDAYAIANFRVGYESADGHWSGAVFVNNIADEEYRTYAFDLSGDLGSSENVLGIERWVGANIRYRW